MHAFELTASKVGLICAIWPIVLCSTTIFFGAIADKIGHGRALKIGLFFQFTAFILMSYSISVTQFITAQVLFGLGKSFFDSSIKAIFAFSFPQDRLPFFFRMRYLLNNAGCIIGPIVGVVLYDSIGKHTFLVSSALYATFLLLFSFMSPVFTRSNYAKESIDGSVSKYQSIKMLQDKNLLVWILSSFVILFVFGAYESMMPLVLSDESSFIKFGYLVSLNGFTVVLVQVFFLMFKNLNSEYKLTLFGFLGFISGFLAFSIPVFGEYKFLLGAFLFSLGEALLFPQMEIKLNDMSPDSNKAAYFGASEIKQAGFFVGPILGGIMYEQFGQKILFIGCSAMLIFSASIYIKTLLRKRLDLSV
jgi:MFS family permease